MRKLIAALALILLLVLGAALVRAEEPKAVTVMIYLIGSDLETDGKRPEASDDVTQMLRSGFDREQVNVVLMTGGTARWKAGFPADATVIYALDKSSAPTEVCRFPLMNMGDPETLTLFLRTCKERYPADDYILIFWNHGMGPLMGLCVDRLFDGDLLTLAEMDQALNDSGIASEKKLMLIGFDACLMGSLEVAVTCAPYADYMVASSELEPGSGWNYGFLKQLGPGLDGARVGTWIIDSYFDEQASAIGRGVPVTLACVDLSRIGTLTETLEPVFAVLYEGLTEESFSKYSINRQNSASVARSTGSEYDLIDLRDFVLRLCASEGIDSAPSIAALDEAVVYSRSTDERLHGLTVYFPLYNKTWYQSSWRGIYGGMAAPDSYAGLVSAFGVILTGESLTDWTLAVVEQEEDDPDHFICYLTPDQQQSFASARLVTLRYDSHRDAYSFINTDPDVTLTSGGYLLADSHVQGLFGVGADGRQLTQPLLHYTSDGFITVPVLLVRLIDPQRLDEFDLEDAYRSANLRLRENPDTGLWEVVDAYESNDSMVFVEIDWRDYDYIQFWDLSRMIARGDDGMPLPFSDWLSTGTYTGTGAYVGDLAGFSFKPAGESGYTYYAFFQITDTQGNVYCSELMPVRNESIEVLPMDILLGKTDTFKAALTRVEINRSPWQCGLTFCYRMANLGHTDQSIVVRHLVINGISIGGSDDNGEVSEGDYRDGAFSVSRATLERNGITRVETVEFEFVIDDDAVISAVAQVDLDISDIVEPPERHVIAAGSTDELALEVEDARVEADGSLVMSVAIHNTSGQALEPYQHLSDEIHGAINGFAFTSRASLELPNVRGVWIADGTVWRGDLRIAPSDPNALDPADREDAFAVFGIREIESVTLDLDGRIVRATFDEPLDYAGFRGEADPGSAIAATPALQSDEMDVAVESVRDDPEDGILIVLRCTNRSDRVLTYSQWDSRTTWLNGDITGYQSQTGVRSGIVRPGETVRMTIRLMTTAEEGVYPLSSILLPLMFTEGGNNVYLPRLTLELTEPLQQGGTVTEGITARQEETEQEDAEPTPVRAEVLLPEEGSFAPRTLSVQLTEEQAANYDWAFLVVGVRFGDDLVVTHLQDAVLTDDGRVEARYPGVVLGVYAPGEGLHDVMTYCGESDGVYTFDFNSVSFIRFSDTAFSSPTVYVTYDPENMTASVTEILYEDAEPFGDQNDYMSAMFMYPVRTIPASDPLPYLGNMPVSDNICMDETTLDGKPMQLCLTAPDPDTDYVIFMTVVFQDGTGFSTPIMPYSE